MFTFTTPPLSPKMSTNLSHPPKWAKAILSAQTALLSHHIPPSTTIHPAHIPLPNKSSLNLLSLHTPSAPPNTSLLLLHGWGGGLGHYAPLLRHLTPHISSIYLLDLPGMGASTRTPHPVSLPRETALDYFLFPLQAAYAHLTAHHEAFRNSTTRHLVAHSLGAYLAVEWLLDSSPAFDTVVLASPVGLPPRPPPSPSSLAGRTIRALWARGFTPQDALRVLPRGVARRFCGRYVERCYAKMDDAEERLFVEYVLAISRGQKGGEGAAATLLDPGAWAKRELVGRFDGVRGRIGFVYGAEDWMDWRWGQKAAREVSDGAGVWRVPKAGHNVFVDNPGAFAEVCLEVWEKSVADGTKLAE